MSGVKTCTACKKEKEFSFFAKNKDGKFGLHSKCKECKNKSSQLLYSKTKEQRLVQINEWRAKNKDLYQRKSREWNKANKSARAAHYAKRRAAVLNRTLACDSEKNDFFIKEIYSARSERSEMTGVMHHVDHIVPLQGETVSGLHVPWNLQVIPAYENLSKGNKYDANV